jgi:hypothetical protein
VISQPVTLLLAGFGSIEDARAFCREFFAWYNTEHCHAGIGLLTAATVHAGAWASSTYQPFLMHKLSRWD